MMRSSFRIVTFFLLLSCSVACTGNKKDKSISSDPAVIAKGEILFNQQCSGCHNFRQNAIGPQLSGITTQQSPQWIEAFVKNPDKIIHSGDKHAGELYKEYKVVMPSFTSLSDEELDEIVAFLHTHKAIHQNTADDGSSMKDPIKEPVATSNLVVELKAITQIPPSDSNKQLLTRITKLDYQPGTKDLFILDLRGKLYKLQNSKPTVYMDMTKLRPAFINQPGLATGFGSFAFHPQFATNGLLYTTHTEAAGTAKADFSYADPIKVTLQWVLTEWKVNNANAPQGRELLRINMVSPLHGVQDIRFNPLAKKGDEDYGLLYIGVGDGGAAEKGYPFLIHSPQKVWGTVLRINPLGNNSKNGHYGIPATNPFVNSKDTNTVKEIYAYGFRNPHRLSWTKKGQLLVGNVGHANIESLYWVNKGSDCGWPIREGTFVINPDGDLNKVYPLSPDDTASHITYPVAEYDHDEGKAISPGFEYTGTIGALQGKYLFGDIPTGRLFFVTANDIQQGKRAAIQGMESIVEWQCCNFKAIVRVDRVDLHFGKDADGEIYIMTKPDGKVYKLVNATE